MLILENISLAIAALKSNKTRAILTMLGIIIGIAAVIAIMTVGSSMSANMTAQMSSRGVKNITVGLEKKEEDDDFWGMMRGPAGPMRDLTKEDYISDEKIENVLEKFGDKIEAIALTESVGNGKTVNGSEYANVDLSGVNEGAFANAKLEMISGREFFEKDYTDGKRVIIVSDYLCNNLYKGDTEAVLGKKLRFTVNGKYQSYTVVGVYKYDSTKSFGGFSESTYDKRTTVYMPFEAAIAQNHNTKGFSSITVVANSVDEVVDLSSEIEEYMNSKFYRNNENYQVSAYSVQSSIEEYSSSMGTMSAAVSAIAGISLLVGGIGVMNIMMVSIVERTREIGTRKALGATNGSIRIQFVVESIILCLIGGIIGIILGMIVGVVAANYMKYPVTPSFASVVFSFGFSLAIGVFFGYYPANKAAKMNPIDALRYE